MSKTSEKLIILQDLNSGLLRRVFGLFDFKEPASFSSNVKKVQRHLVEKFAQNGEDVERASGYSHFEKSASQLVQDLEEYYHTMVDAARFQHACIQLFEDLSKNIVDFRMDTNPDLMTRFLDLMVGYVQLNMLIERLETMPMVAVASYTRAHLIAKKNSHPDSDITVTYLVDFQVPVTKMQDSCKNLGLRVGDALMNICETFYKWNDNDNIKRSGIFNLLDKHANLGEPLNAEQSLAFGEMQYLHKMKQWVIYGFLVCPGELQRDGALDLLQAALSDGFVIPMFRNKMFDPHKEYPKLFSSFQINMFRLDKHKKILRNAEIGAVRRSGFKHSEFRATLRIELTSMLKLLKEIPGLIAPYLQLIFAILSLAKNEVLWYFHHIGVAPPSKKGYKEAHWIDENLPTLLHHIDELSRLVLAYQPLIAEYFLEFLTDVDVPAAAPLIAQVDDEGKVNIGVRSLVMEIIANLRAIKDTPDHKTKSLEGLRLNWYRASSSLSGAQSGSASKANSVRTLVVAMNEIVVHTRNCDRIEAELRKTASLCELWYFRKQLVKIFEQSLKNSTGQPRYCLTFVRIINSSLENVHRSFVPEQEVIGRASLSLAEKLMNAICVTLERNIKDIANRESKLQYKTEPMEAATRLGNLRSKPGQKKPIPGFESYFKNRKAVEGLRLNKKIVAEICGACRETESLVVYDNKLYPSSFLYDKLVSSFKDTIRSLIKSKEKSAIQRPSVMLAHLTHVIRAYLVVDKHINIHVGEIIQQVLFKEFYDSSSGKAGDVMDFSTKQSSSKRIIHMFANWYVNFLEKKLGDNGVVYSNFIKGFTSWKHSSGLGFRAEHYTDIHELRALCQMAGPYGIRVMDKALLQAVKKHTGVIKKVLTENHPVLKKLYGRLQNAKEWWDGIHKIKGMDTVVQHSITIGCILKFRKTLHDALEDIVKRKVPFIHETVSYLRSHYGEMVDTSVADLESLAYDSGINVGAADLSLREALKEWNQTPQDENIWALIPELFGCSFASNIWKDVAYVVNHEALSNNGHLVSETVNSLATAVLAVSIDDGRTKDREKVDALIQSTLERFVHVASYTLLHMSRNSDPYLSKFKNYSTTTILVFLEHFIRTSDRLSLVILENCCPFTILRSSYTHLIERATKGSIYTHDAEDEQKEAF